MLPRVGLAPVMLQTFDIRRKSRETCRAPRDCQGIVERRKHVMVKRNSRKARQLCKIDILIEA
jgi:hypothetical protein